VQRVRHVRKLNEAGRVAQDVEIASERASSTFNGGDHLWGELQQFAEFLLAEILKRPIRPQSVHPASPASSTSTPPSSRKRSACP
jgi:hypothetical protein